MAYQYDIEAEHVYDNVPAKPQHGDQVVYHGVAKVGGDHQDGRPGWVSRVDGGGASVMVKLDGPYRPDIILIPPGNLALIRRAAL